MINPIHKQYGVRDPTPRLEPLVRPSHPRLPKDHPCHSCKLLEWHTGVPYCFLPRCDREIFKTDGRDVNRE